VAFELLCRAPPFAPNWDYVPRDIIPHQHDRPAELLVRVIEQLGVIGFGEALRWWLPGPRPVCVR